MLNGVYGFQVVFALQGLGGAHGLCKEALRQYLSVNVVLAGMLVQLGVGGSCRD